MDAVTGTLVDVRARQLILERGGDPEQYDAYAAACTEAAAEIGYDGPQPTAVQGQEIDDRAREILDARGVYEPTAEQYLRACIQAERELQEAVRATEEAKPDRRSGAYRVHAIDMAKVSPAEAAAIYRKANL